MSLILNLNFAGVKILMLPLLLFCILETCTNNLITVLSVLVAWQRNDKSLFCEVEFSYNWISSYSFSTITNQILGLIAHKNETTADDNGQILLKNKNPNTSYCQKITHFQIAIRWKSLLRDASVTVMNTMLEKYVRKMLLNFRFAQKEV